MTTLEERLARGLPRVADRVHRVTITTDDLVDRTAEDAEVLAELERAGLVDPQTVAEARRVVRELNWDDDEQEAQERAVAELVATVDPRTILDAFAEWTFRAEARR